MYIIFISSVLSSFSFFRGGGGGGVGGWRYYHLTVNGHEIKHCLFG